MEQITTTVYTFDELSEFAQNTALDNARYSDVNLFEWWETTYEDVATIAELFGLDIRQTRKQSSDGKKHWYDPTIYFSGFSSQGDGACFEGYYQYKKGALKAVKEYAPQDNELHNIVKQLQELQKSNFYRITCRTKQRGYYNHSGCMDVEVENKIDSYLDIKNEDDFIQCMRDFADWIYERLEEEYDYLTSDECIKERVLANDVRFTENGEVLY